ncbi:hypothetical protein RclHR1_14480001 [Rhizophagus clarus]|uniref:Protein kinase domain-containing protein n=1 Tax=Rhizophagus clarus TaxID=94130 RepID=A0A2Z6R5F3_9GLOM|nr:hypothetical protein RclHR1_14480001 [Rhizophagus clarus]
MTLVAKWIDQKIKDKYIHYFEYDKFSQIVEIGRGGFGKVSRAYLANTGLVALKSFVDENSDIEEDELNRLDDEFVKELELLREVDYHQNINRILGITKVSRFYILVLEYANEGNLRDYLKKKFTLLKWNDKIQMALDITCGLRFLHFKEIIHRDLHSKNILVNNGKLLIADLGLSKKLAEVTTNSLANTKGMIEYTEPQCFKSAKYKKNKKSDIYSLGALLWEISSGKRLFPDYSQNILPFHIGYSKLREEPIDGTPKEYQQLYQECWNDEPNLRPDIEKVYETLSQIKIENPPHPQSLQLIINKINYNTIDNDDLNISYSLSSIKESSHKSNELTEKELKNDDINIKKLIIKDSVGNVTYNNNQNNNSITSQSLNIHLNKKNIKIENNIHIVVGLDFGTTYSGFAYCHVNEKNHIISNDSWPETIGPFKINTALQYDKMYKNVKSWGYSALVKKPKKPKSKYEQNSDNNKLVEPFKLLLDEPEQKLPVDYQKAITDYLGEIGKLIKETVETRWPRLDYFENVLLVLTVPIEFYEKLKAIIRICAFDAKLIKEKCSTNLQVITDSEAAAVCCMKELGHDPVQQGIDCSDDTIDLITLKLINNGQLAEIKRTRDFSGNTFINAEFIKYLRKMLGDEPIDLLRENHYGQMQYLIQDFCRCIKIPFTGDEPDFLYKFDIEEIAPILKQYITYDKKETLEEDEWIIEIDFKTIESIFKPVIQKILMLINDQLDNNYETCSAMFLVGGFNESKYLQNKVKQKFCSKINNISVVHQPISHGAVIYGLNNIGNDEYIESDYYHNKKI